MKIYLILLFILLVSIVFRIHLINSLLINSFISEPLFISDLLGNGIVVPWRLIFLLDLCNILLFFIIGKKFLNPNLGLLASFLYGISPWAPYAQLFGSIYILLLSFFLIFFLGILLLNKKDVKGMPMIIISSSVLLYSSFQSWFILPLLTFTIYKMKLINISYLKILIFTIIIIFISVIWLSSKNFIGFMNVFKNQVDFLSDPGIKNSINQFKGESNEAGFNLLAKVSENKYTYMLRYLTLKSIKNIVPSTFFTSQEKLFNFSFSPPLYVGFLPPFFYGLILVVKSNELRKYLLLSVVFIVPSFLSKILVELNRLILFYPVVIFLISFGLIKLHDNKNLILRFVLYLSLFLAVLQIVITFLDIGLREHQRYILSI